MPLNSIQILSVGCRLSCFSGSAEGKPNICFWVDGGFALAIALMTSSQNFCVAISGPIPICPRMPSLAPTGYSLICKPASFGILEIVKFGMDQFQVGSVQSSPGLVSVGYPDQPLRRQKHPRVDRRIRSAVRPGNQLVNAFLLGDGFTTHQGFSFQTAQPMFCEIVLNSLAEPGVKLAYGKISCVWL